MDAGHGVREAREHLRESFDPELDRRASTSTSCSTTARGAPTIIFDTDRWESYERADGSTSTCFATRAGRPFLLLAGPEPDTQWERFVAALIIVIEKLEREPHGWAAERPVGRRRTRARSRSRRTGSRASFSPTPPHGIGRVQVPGCIGHLLEYRLGMEGRPASRARRTHTVLPVAARVSGRR